MSSVEEASQSLGEFDEELLQEGSAEEYLEEIEEDEQILMESQEKISTPYLTKYERARILGTRAMQISRNAPVFV